MDELMFRLTIEEWTRLYNLSAHLKISDAVEEEELAIFQKLDAQARDQGVEDPEDLIESA